MIRIAVLGVCLCLFPYCAMTAFAEEQPSKQTQGANISVSIPEQYTITVIAPKGAEASLNDGATSTITVDRFGEFDFEIKLKEGYRLLQVLLNDEDITDQLVNMTYHGASVYENMLFQIITEPITSETTTSSSTESSTTTSEDTSPTTSDSSTSSDSPATTNSTDSKTDSSQSGTTSSQGTTTSADSRTTPNNDSPNTGDIAHVGLWTALILSFGVVMIAARRKSDDDE